MLQQAVSIERDRVTSVQWELEECKTALMNLEEQILSEKVVCGIYSSLTCSLQIFLIGNASDFCEICHSGCVAFLNWLTGM